VSSARSVQAAPDVSTLVASSLARVSVVGHDPFGVFARAAVREQVRRLTIVSPWVAADGGDRLVSFRELVARVDRRGGSVVLVTRPTSSQAHAAAIDCVAEARRGTVHLNSGLHAKLFVCEARGRGSFAVIGSANASAGSSSLDELALFVRPARGSRIVKNLAGVAVRGLLSTSSTRP
jgi:hypothetical protein